MYRPIYDVVTAWQQAVWSIVADIPRIRPDNANAVNFGNNIEHSLLQRLCKNLSHIGCVFIEQQPSKVGDRHYGPLCDVSETGSIDI